MKNQEIKKIATILKEIQNSIIISGHKHADYDSMCSSLALALCLKKIGKTVAVYIEKESKSSIEYFNCNEFYVTRLLQMITHLLLLT